MQLGEDKPFLEMLPDVIKSYGMSMMYGHSHTSQSLPRMLTLWFEFGTFLHAFRASSKGAVSPGLAACMHGCPVGCPHVRIAAAFPASCAPSHAPCSLSFS